MMTTDQAIDLARKIIGVVNDQVKATTGQSLVANAWALATPAITKVLPAASAILPILKSVLLPAVENVLLPQEYDTLTRAISDMEAGIGEIVAAVDAEQKRVSAMTDKEVQEYARTHNLYRDQPG